MEGTKEKKQEEPEEKCTGGSYVEHTAPN